MDLMRFEMPNERLEQSHVDPDRLQAAQIMRLQEVADCAVGETRSRRRCAGKVNVRDLGSQARF